MVLRLARRLFKWATKPRCRIVFVHGFNNSASQIEARALKIRKCLPDPERDTVVVQRWFSAAGLANHSGWPEPLAALLYPVDNFLTRNLFAGKRLFRHLLPIPSAFGSLVPMLC